MKKETIGAIVAGAGLLLFLAIYLLQSNSSDQSKLTIGIVQTMSHPALDQAREGFEQIISAHLGQEVRFIRHNAEGIESQALAIAQSIKQDERIKAVFTIGSLATQALAKIERQKPIIVAAVTDPKSLYVAREKSNVTGVTDRIDVVGQIAFIKALLPKALKIAILYNPAEMNSQAMVKEMLLAAKQHGMQAETRGVHSMSEIGQVVTLACEVSDLILIPADNLLVSAMPLLSKAALAKKCPLIASDPPSVHKGALAAFGVDYHVNGQKAAQIALEILAQQKAPFEIGIHHPHGFFGLINEPVLKALNLTAPTSSENMRIEILKGKEAL